MRSREVACGLVVSVLVGGVQACSVFSGWSDLQSGSELSPRDVDAAGQREDDGGASSDGASGHPDASGRDAGSGDTGSVPPHCSESSCAPGVCCIGILGGASCSASCSFPATTVVCAGASDCPGPSVCCLLPTRRTQCQESCGGDPTVCNPDEATPCASGTCSPRADVPGLDTCQ